MTGPSNKKPKPTKGKPVKLDESGLDLDPNAWEKFESLVKGAAKMGPKPHNTTGRVPSKKKK